jgi:uncharacterized protein
MHCHHESMLIAANYPIIISLFLTGLVGSFTHCVGMCGPIVMAQIGSKMSHIPADKMNNLHRITGGALITYHLGRLTTYTFFGIIASLVVNFLFTPNLKYFAAFLLIIAAIIFLSSAFNFKNDFFGKYINKHLSKIFMNSFIGKLATKISNNPSGFKGYILGILLGFLPCGLIYAAVAAVSSFPPLIAGVAMAFFALGTMPSLILVGCTSNIVLHKYQKKLMWFAKIIMAINAVTLIYMAIKLLG